MSDEMSAYEKDLEAWKQSNINNQTREQGLRENNTRQTMSLAPNFTHYTTTVSNIDQGLVPPDKVYGWLPLSVRGESLAGDVNNKIRLGWKPVPPTRHAELTLPKVMQTIYGKESELYSQTVFDRGRILMEMDLSQWNALQDSYRNADAIKRQDVDRINQEASYSHYGKRNTIEFYGNYGNAYPTTQYNEIPHVGMTFNR